MLALPLEADRIAFGVLLAWQFAGAEAVAACALEAKPVASDLVGYRERGSRCEGLFVRKVAAGDRLAILASTSTTLVMSWMRLTVRHLPVRVAGKPNSATIELQAVSLRPDQYYQMDTRAVGADGAYRWPTEVLQQPEVRLEPSELAVLACEESVPAGASENLPVSVVGSRAEAPDPSPRPARTPVARHPRDVPDRGAQRWSLDPRIRLRAIAGRPL